MKKTIILLTGILYSLIALSQFSDIEVKYLLGTIYYQKGEYDFCKELMDDYIEISEGKIDNNFIPYVYIGMCYYMQKDYDNSLSAFIKDIDYDPTRSLYSVSALYALKGDKENALLWLEKSQKSHDAYSKSVIETDPDWTGMFNDVDVQALLNKDLRPQYKKLSDSADYYVSINNLDMALEMMNQAISLEPENVKAYHGKGTIYLQMQEYDKAIEAFKKENEIESATGYSKTKRYIGYQSLGVALSYKKDYSGAIYNLKKAINGNKTLYVSLIDLASLQIGNDDLQGAKESIKQYLALIDDDEIAHYIAGLVYLNLGQSELSIQHANKAIDLAKERSEVVPQEYYDLRGY